MNTQTDPNSSTSHVGIPPKNRLHIWSMVKFLYHVDEVCLHDGEAGSSAVSVLGSVHSRDPKMLQYVCSRQRARRMRAFSLADGRKGRFCCQASGSAHGGHGARAQ